MPQQRLAAVCRSALRLLAVRAHRETGTRAPGQLQVSLADKGCHEAGGKSIDTACVNRSSRYESSTNPRRPPRGSVHRSTTPSTRPGVSPDRSCASRPSSCPRGPSATTSTRPSRRLRALPTRPALQCPAPNPPAQAHALHPSTYPGGEAGGLRVAALGSPGARGRRAVHQRPRRGRGWQRGQRYDERFMKASRTMGAPQRGHGSSRRP